MKNIFFLLVLVLLFPFTSQQTLLVVSNPYTTIITNPDNLNVGSESTHNQQSKKISNDIGLGAQWIWQAGGPYWPHGQTLQFQTQFYAPCNGSASLKITADDMFTAVLNGVGAQMTGNNWTKIYTFPLSPLKCGLNTIAISATNIGEGSGAALVFSVTQDQSSCFNCLTPLSFFNRDTCQCECNLGCECEKLNKNYSWHGYPICGCSCRALKCKDYQYFNQKSCSCQCKPTACLPCYIQSPRSCQCIKSPRICPLLVKPPPCAKNGQEWSQAYCECVCKNPQICQSPLVWDNDSCKCQAKVYA